MAQKSVESKPIANSSNGTEVEIDVETLMLLLSLMRNKSDGSETEHKHDPYISGPTIAKQLDYSSILHDIEKGLSFLACCGIIDVLDDILASMGFANKRKQKNENWAQYTDGLSMFTSRLSVLDIIALGVETGCRIVLKCHCLEDDSHQLDIFNVCQSSTFIAPMIPILFNCTKCKFVNDENHSHKIAQIKKHWRIQYKFNLLDSLYLFCMNSSQMKPKYDIECGKDLDLNSVLNELAKLNKDSEFLNIATLAKDVQLYEECKRKSSTFMGKFCEEKEENTNNFICHYATKQVTEWCTLYKKQSPPDRKLYYHELVAVLSQAVYLWVDSQFYPRHTQIVPIFISIQYVLNHYGGANSDRKGVLFEIGTGEGKSVVVLLMAAMQCLLFDQVIDVTTSQTLLAEREAEESTDFFKMLSLGKDGAAYIDQNSSEETRYEDYRAKVVYSTAHNYECDFLHKESGKKSQIDCRGNRQFAVNIVDEVDNSFIDLALQSTQLSSPTPGFKDINKILFIIFSRMRYAICTLGRPYIVDGSLYFMPVSATHHQIDIISQIEQSIAKKVCVGTVIANQLLAYYKDEKEKAIELLNEYGLVANGFSYKKLIGRINLLRKENGKLFLQLISKKCIFGINTLVMSKRADVTSGNEEVDFYCYFQDGAMITDNISVCGFEGYVAMQLVASTDIDWNHLMCLIKSNDNSYEKLIKDNTRRALHAYIANSAALPSFVSCVVTERLDIWIDSCWTALFYYQEKRDYIVDEDRNKILTVDRNNTGCIQHKMKLRDGLHEFLQIKHGLKMSTIGTAANIVTHSFYFNLFDHVYGLTGTLGGDREIKYYKNCFHVDVVRIPSFRKKENIRYQNIYCNNYGEWIKMILMSTYSKLQKGCAVLIIAESIESVDTIHHQLMHNNAKYGNVMKLPCLKYSRQDNEERQSVSVKLRGGNVIVATNLAGRGTDIKLQSDVNKNGGLHVILTFMSPNIRIEKQALGRTARAGHPGSCVVVVNKQNCRYTHDEVGDHAIPKLRDIVAEENINGLEERVKAQERIGTYYQKFIKTLLPEICSNHHLNDHAKNQIFYKWALSYNKMDASMDDAQLNNIYNDFAMNIRVGVRQNNIGYNPHYWTVDGICENSWSSLSQSSADLGSDFNGIAKYLMAGREIEGSETAQSAAIGCLQDAANSFGKYLQRAKELNYLCTSKDCMNKRIGWQKNIKLFGRGTLSGQTNFEMKYWKILLEICSENIKQLAKSQNENDGKAKVSHESINYMLCDIEDYDEYRDCIVDYYKQCGMFIKWTFESKPKKPKIYSRIKGFFMALIGALTVVAGAVCCAVGYVSCGVALMTKGVGAVIQGITAMVSGECDVDFGDWLKSYALEVGMTALTGGLGGVFSTATTMMSSFMPSTLVAVGKKIFDVGKRLVQNDFDLFDLVDVGSAFIPECGQIIDVCKTAVNIGQTAVNVAQAVESGDMSNILEAGQSAINKFGGETMKNATNNVMKYGKTGIKLANNIKDGNFENVIDMAGNVASDFVDNEMGKNLIDSTRKGAKIANDLANGGNAFDAMAAADIGCDMFDDMKNNVLCNAFDEMKGADFVNDIGNCGDMLDGIKSNISMLGKINEIQSNDMDDVKCNLMPHNFDDIKGFMQNANAVVKQAKHIRNVDNIIEETLKDHKAKIQSMIKVHFAENCNIKKELEVMAIFVDKQYEKTDDEEFKKNIKSSKEFLQRIFVKKVEDIYKSNKRLEKEIKSISSMIQISNDIELKSNDLGLDKILNVSKLQQSIQRQIEEITNVYKTTLDEVCHFAEIMNEFKTEIDLKDTKEKNIDVLILDVVHLQFVGETECNNNMCQDFMNCVMENINVMIYKQLADEIEYKLVEALKPNQKLIDSVDPTDLINKMFQ